MSSNKTALLGVVAFAQLCQGEIHCPADPSHHPLASVMVYDGPPQEKADLIAEHATGTGRNAVLSWSVGYIFDAGRTLFLVCKYAGLDASQNQTVKVENKVERCVFHPLTKNRPAEVTCR